MKKLSCRRKETMLIYNYRIPLQYGGIHDGEIPGVRHQCGQPNVNLRKEAEKNERILQEAESCIK